jgi:hypothetical protein
LIHGLCAGHAKHRSMARMTQVGSLFYIEFPSVKR